MKQFLLVVRFELETMIKKKSFLISTVLVVVLAFGILSLPRVFNPGKKEHKNTQDKTMMIYDPAGVLEDQALVQESFPEYKIMYEQGLESIKDQVQKGEVNAGFEVKDALTFTYLVKNSSLNDALASRFQGVMQQQYQISALQDLKYDAAKVASIYQATALFDTTVLGTDGMNNYFYTYALIILLYMMILVYGNQIGVSVASEKSNRAVEILTTSCSSNALIFGKVIAGAITGVFQTAIMIGSCLLAYQLNADVWQHALDAYLNIPSLVLITFALFGILGYLLFSFLFGAIGALCSKVEEVNGATLPIQLLIIVAFMLSFITMQMPESILSKIVIYVPFTSWIAMFINVALGSASMIEIGISLAILAITVVGAGLLGAKLYRRGTLTYGNAMKFSNLLKMLKQKDS